MGVDIRRKIENIMKFTERMKKIQEKEGAVLRKAQKKMKQQANRRKMKIKE